MSSLVGSLVEAWDELRIHKVRVLLALIGVAVAVTAITSVTALVHILQQGYTEASDRSGGREVTVTLDAYPTSAAPTAAQRATLEAAYQQVAARYHIDWSSRDVQSQLRARIAGSTQNLSLHLVDAQYGTIYRVQVTDGRWFSRGDADALAPGLVVNKAFLRRLGVSDLADHPTVLLGSDQQVRATVIGVYAEPYTNESPAAYALVDPVERWQLENGTGSIPQLVAWVPKDLTDALSARLRRDLQAALPGWQVSVSDNRDRSSSAGLTGATRWVALGVGGFALLLGGLGLVNISLTTVRYRIREIGIRRSFGATSGRVFFAVMMESVVATVVAGLVGVVLAVVVIKSVPLDRLFDEGLQDSPPFPATAALVGLACATGVGALAGLLPALVAVRVKVIDAIRY